VSFEGSNPLAYRVLAVSFSKKRKPSADRFRVRWVARAPVGLLVRTVLLAVVAIGGAVWALHRHYTHELAPMVVPLGPVPAKPAPTYDADAGEIPVPELEPSPR
jgi:hypothetical protein